MAIICLLSPVYAIQLTCMEGGDFLLALCAQSLHLSSYRLFANSGQGLSGPALHAPGSRELAPFLRATGILSHDAIRNLAEPEGKRISVACS